MVILGTTAEEPRAFTVHLGVLMLEGPVPPEKALKTRLLLALIGTSFFVVAVVAIFCGISSACPSAGNDSEM